MGISRGGYIWVQISVSDFILNFVYKKVEATKKINALPLWTRFSNVMLDACIGATGTFGGFVRRCRVCGWLLEDSWKNSTKPANTSSSSITHNGGMSRLTAAACRCTLASAIFER